jgi:uncharacterized protein (DUF58 family)
VILPTKRALIVLAAVTPVALIGYFWVGAIDLLVMLDVAWLFLVGLDVRLAAGPRAVSVVRDGVSAFSVGRETTIQYVWVNDSSRAARLTVRETRPDLLGGPQESRWVAVASRKPYRESVTVVPRRRGREEGGWLAVRSLGPMGFGVRQWRVVLPWQVTVYPSLPASRLKASIAEAVRRRETGLRSMRQLGEGRQFESLRTYVPGDDPRHLDWKASARRRKLIVRQFEEERRQQVLIVLDAGRLLTADIEGEARMEHVVRAALWLAFAANHHDDNVGIMVFSDEVHQYVMPQRGRRGLQQILDALAVVQPKLVESDYPAAFRYLAVRNRKRSLTVLFTDVIDRLASEALVANVASLRPRHLPLIVTLRNPDLDAAAVRRPETITEAYRKAAAEELLAERDDALFQMRRSGAVVLDVPPRHAARAVVDRYQELKRKGRL